MDSRVTCLVNLEGLVISEGGGGGEGGRGREGEREGERERKGGGGGGGEVENKAKKHRKKLCIVKNVYNVHVYVHACTYMYYCTHNIILIIHVYTYTGDW